MKDEIKEKIYKLRAYLGTEENWLLNDIADYMTNLQQRIDKAIEYIKWQQENPQYDNLWRKYECEGLIKILKGDDENESYI